MNVATATAAAMLAAVTTLLNGGTLVFYGGTQPTTPETALSGNTALTTFTYATPSFGAPSYVSPNEQASASLVSTSSNPTANGTASFARAFTSGGAAVADLTIGTSGTDIVVGSTTISIGVPVTISSYVHRLLAS